MQWFGAGLKESDPCLLLVVSEIVSVPAGECHNLPVVLFLLLPMWLMNGWVIDWMNAGVRNHETHPNKRTVLRRLLHDHSFLKSCMVATGCGPAIIWGSWCWRTTKWFPPERCWWERWSRIQDYRNLMDGGWGINVGPASRCRYCPMRCILFCCSRECCFLNFISKLFISSICRILRFHAVQDPFSCWLQEEVFLVHCLCLLQLVFINKEDLYWVHLCPLGWLFLVLQSPRRVPP